MRVRLHGSFKREADARKKARSLGSKAEIRPTTVRGEPRFSVITPAPATPGRGRGTGRKRSRSKHNPTGQRLTKIYDEVLEVIARKGPGHLNCDAACKRADHTYRHTFSTRPAMFGTADRRTLLIRS